jgi:type VI secretion system secreted protein Hcp
MKRSSLKRLVSTGVVATGMLAASSAMAAVDMFLKMDGVSGEATDPTHKGEIDVLAWSWGESTGSARTRRGVRPIACIQDLSLTKYVDSASPTLIMDTMVGTVVPTAVLTIRKAGASPLEYIVLTMRDVSVSSYQTGGSGGEDRLTENVTLHFQTMQGQYRKSDGSDPITFEIGGESRGCQP